MKPYSRLKFLMAIIIIIAGVLIIVVPKPPECIVCGYNFNRLLEIIQIATAIASLVIVNRLANEQAANR